MRPTSTGLDLTDLRRVFVLSAVVTVLVGIVALPFSVEWSARYSLLSALALVNWVALALILIGISRSRATDVVIGAMIKPLVLGMLIVYAKVYTIEITSFLLAANTFFITLFLYMGVWHVALNRRVALAQAHRDERNQHG